VKNAVPLSFLLIASASTSAATSPASAATPLILLWRAGWAIVLVWGVSLRIVGFLSHFPLYAKNISGISVRGIYGIGSISFVGLVGFGRFLLLRLLLHTHSEVIV
jgi:hypothetical protein